MCRKLGFHVAFDPNDADTCVVELALAKSHPPTGADR
jgi:hypothetical protein